MRVRALAMVSDPGRRREKKSHRHQLLITLFLTLLLAFFFLSCLVRPWKLTNKGSGRSECKMVALFLGAIFSLPKSILRRLRLVQKGEFLFHVSRGGDESCDRKALNLPDLKNPF